MVAPFEHLMARTKLCQALQNKCVFVPLIVGSKSVLVKQHWFGITFGHRVNAAE
jgi:hypothetical protein